MTLLHIIDTLCDVTTKQADLLRELVTDLEHMNQVSEEEKNAEQAMRKIKISTCMASDESNVVHSFFLIDKYV